MHRKASLYVGCLEGGGRGGCRVPLLEGAAWVWGGVPREEGRLWSCGVALPAAVGGIRDRGRGSVGHTAGGGPVLPKGKDGEGSDTCPWHNPAPPSSAPATQSCPVAQSLGVWREPA